MSTRVADLVEVGHGVNAVVLSLIGKQSAVVLTASQAERLGVYLVRQAAYARAALAESNVSDPDRSRRESDGAVTTEIRDLAEVYHQVEVGE